jgi:hypothetical protein
LKTTRSDWQNSLSQFRNTYLEHQGGEREEFEWFYKPENAETLFKAVSETITNILPMLLELHLRGGIQLIEQDPNDPGPRWARRFRYQFISANPKDSSGS